MSSRRTGEHWGRLLALLTGQLRSLDLAEECLADAYERALTAWRDEVPAKPDAWLFTTARRRGIHLLRRDQTLARKLPLLITDEPPAQPEEDGEVSADERLRLLVTCCHPALAKTRRCPAITCCRRYAPTCCAGWAGSSRPPPTTGRRWR